MLVVGREAGAENNIRWRVESRSCEGTVAAQHSLAVNFRVLVAQLARCPVPAQKPTHTVGARLSMYLFWPGTSSPSLPTPIHVTRGMVATASRRMLQDHHAWTRPDRGCLNKRGLVE